MPGKPPPLPGGYQPETGVPGGESALVSMPRDVSEDSKFPGNGICVPVPPVPTGCSNAEAGGSFCETSFWTLGVA